MLLLLIKKAPMKSNVHLINSLTTKFITAILFVALSVFQSTAQTILIDPNGDGGFENGTSFSANGWTLVNGTGPNKWHIGNAGGAMAGTNKAYISDNSGLTNTYSIDFPERVHFYRDITFPANETVIKLTFKWLAQGESLYDYLLVCVMPVSQTPTASNPTPVGSSNWTAISTTYPGSIILSSPPNLNLQGTVQTQTIDLPQNFAGTTQRLVFMWSCDGFAGTNPPASIDAIALLSRLPGTIHSIASGNYSDAATWQGGNIPSAGDSVLIDSGHTVILDGATALSVNYLRLDGTLNFSATTTTLKVAGDLVIDSGAVFNVFTNNTGKKLEVAGNITNNGTINLAKTGAMLTLNGKGTQAIGGSGILDSTNIIAGLTFNNTAAQPIINWGWQNVVISAGGLIFNGGWVSMGATNSVVVGNGVTAPISVTSGGFTNGTVKRWFNTTGAGTTILAGSQPSFSLGSYPFISGSPATGYSPAYFHRETAALTAAGTFDVTFNHAPGMNTLAIPASENGYSITRQTNTTWTVATGSTYTSTADHLFAAQGQGLYTVFTTNTRLLKNGALIGTHQTGTLSPIAGRAAIPAAAISGTYTLAIDSSEEASYTIASGAWNNPAIWSNGVPSCGKAAEIKAADSVWIDGSMGTINASYLIVRGSLAITGSTLNIGCAGNSSNVPVLGKLYVSGGNLNINGSLKIESNAIFSHTGGFINVDGNAGGAIAGSVPSGTPIVNIITSNLILSGGVFTVVDPHTGTVSAANNVAFAYTGTAAINNTTGWTLKFGNGVSTDAGGALATPIGFMVNIAGGRIIIDSLVIDAGLSGLNRFVTLANSTSFGCNQLHITSNGDARVGSLTVFVAGNIINNGVLVTTGTIGLGTYLNLTVAASSVSQTISGTGYFKNNATAPTANFTHLLINNNSVAGVVFANQNSLRSNTNTGTVSNNFSLLKGLVNTLNDTFVLGTSPTALGALNFTNDSGGFTSGSIFSRWWGTTSGAGSTISAGLIPTTNTGAYPFAIPSGVGTKTINRIVWLRQLSASTTGGRISIQYIDGTGRTPVSIVDGSYTVDNISNAKWNIGYTGITGSPTYAAAINGGGMYVPANSNSRIVGATTALGGTHQAGTILPHAQRSGIPLSNLNSTWFMGISNGDTAVSTIASGNWNNPLIWSSGNVPTCNDYVTVSQGHSVTIDTAHAWAKGMNILVGGSLTLSDSSLTLGCSGINNASLIVAGTLNVTGGLLTVNGNLNFQVASTFVQSGGAINVDGNAAGNLANSVPSGTPIASIATANVSLTGGVFTVVDPHTGTTSAANNIAFNYVGTAAINNTNGWTLKFGNGISTDAGGALTTPVGFYLNIGGGKIVIDSLVVDAGVNGLNRFVTFTPLPLGCNNLYITTNGDARNTGTAYVAKNITNNGILVNTGSLYLGTYLSATIAPSSFAQTISGTGYFKNNATTPTANFTSLTINNTNATGVIFAGQNAMRSNANTGTVSGSFNIIKGLVNTVNDTFILGTSTTLIGTLIFSNDSGNFVSGSIFSRWWGTAVSGATITSGQVPTSAVGAYPFTSVSGTKPVNRILWLRQNTVAATGGRIHVKFIDGVGLTPASVADGSYITDSISNAKWIVSYSNITGTPTYIASVNGAGLYIAANINSRIVGATAAAGGVHQPGTMLPNIQRAGLSLSDLNNTWHIGISRADIANQTITSGNWNDPLIWSKKTVPTCGDSIMILPGHTVLVSTVNANVRSIAIAVGGTLTISGNSLTVGCTNNNASVIVNGTLTVAGGDLTINGSLKIADGAVFNQSAGNIILDGNAAGNVANSVPAGTNILEIRSHLVSWTGGVFTIVDPHISGSSYTFYFNNNTASIEVSLAHTFIFGNGISTDLTTNTQGFTVYSIGDVTSARFHFGNVIIKGTNSATAENRRVYSVYNFIVKGDFSVYQYGVFENGSTLRVAGNITVNAGGKLIASSISLALGTGNGIVSPSITPQTISGAGIFLNTTSTTVPVYSTSDLLINNTSAGGVTIARPFSISGGLTLTYGIIHTTATDSFQLNSTVTGGSITAYVDGPCYRKFIASRTAAGTFNNTTIIPIGKNGRYLPIWVDPTTTASGTIVLKSEVFANTNPTPGALSISPYIWEARLVRDSVNFVGARIQLSDTASVLTDSSRILQAPAITGNFSAAPVANSYTPGTTKFLSSSVLIPASEYAGVVTYGRLAPCSAPLSQPASFVASNIQGTAFDVSFTSVSGPSTQYLVVRYASGAVATAPVNETNYIIGAALGTGTVVSKQKGTTFTQAGLTLNTTYDYYIYAFNNTECHGPIYNTTAPLFATVTTCASTILPPAALSSFNIHISSFTIKWNKSFLPGATYSFDVSTASDFSSFLPGYQAVATTDTFATITGADPFTTYYIRARTISNSCYSVFTNTLNIITLCGPATLPYMLNFESSLVCNKAEKFGSGNIWGIPNNPGFGFTNRTLMYNFSTAAAANAWYYTQALNLTAGVLYRISFKYGTNNNVTPQKLAIRYGSAPWAATMNDTLTMLPLINNTSPRTYVTDFTPDTSGVYFIGFNSLSPISPSTNLYIDDVKIDSARITCKAPEGLFVNGITADSAILNWTLPATSPKDGYLYYVQLNRYGAYPTTETVPTGTIPSGDSSAVLTNLIPGKKYTVWMRSICGDDSSAWTTKPVSFTTGCGIVKSFPWIEDFEDAVQPAMPACWTVINANNDDDSFETYMASPWQAYNQSASIYTLYNAGANDDYLILPPMLLTGHQQLRYSIRSLGGSDANDYKIVLSTTGKNPADFTTTLKPLTVATSFSYVWDSLTLAHYNDTVYIAFQVPPGGLGGYYLFIDNITVENLPACVAPTSVVTNSISPTSFSAKWQAAFPAPSNGYKWELRTSGIPASGPAGLIYTDTTGTDSVYINGLIPDSVYTLYVRSDCGGEYSTWAMLTFKTLCGSVNIPYTQNFESVVVPNIYRCDRIENLGAGNNWATVNNPGSGFTSKTLRYVAHTYAANAWFYTQGLNLTAGVAYRLKFRYGNNNWNYIEKLLIKYDTNATSNMKDTLGIFTSISVMTSQSFSKDFVPKVSGVYYIGFNCFSDAGQSNLSIDDIIVEHSPCLSPAAITVSGITPYAATFSWAESLSSPGSGYEWEVRASGTAGSGATGLVASGLNPLATLSSTVTTFSPNTPYTFYIRSNCGAGFSPWDSSVFRTNCVIGSVPFLQDFESVAAPAISYCDKVEGDNLRWRTAYNPKYGFENNTLVFSPWSNAATNASYYTQGIRLKGGFKYRITFDYAGSENFGYVNTKFAVKYGLAPTSAAMQNTLFVLPNSFPYYNGKNYCTVDFIPTTTGVYYFGFNCFPAAYEQSWLYIDNIALQTLDVSPIDVTVNMMTASTGNMLWTAPKVTPTEGYEWEIRTSGNAGSGLTGLVASGALDSTNVNITGLAPNTTYTAYVRSMYDSGYISSWVPSVFTTSCIVKNVPYNENFESVTPAGIPACSKTETLGDQYYSWTTDFLPQNGMTGSALRLNSASSPINAWFYTEGISLIQGHAYRLSFKYLKYAAGTQKFTVRYGTSPAQTSMKDTIAQLLLATSPQTYTIDFVPSKTAVYYLGFNGFSTTYEDVIYLDDISLIQLPACIMPDVINIGKVLYNAVSFSWPAPIIAPNNGYDWEIRTSGNGGSGATGLALSGNAVTPSVNTSGLNPATQYNVYVRSNCGTGTSTWDSSAVFITPCTPVNTPYTENFETVIVPQIPVCSKAVYDAQWPSYWAWGTGPNATSTSTGLVLKNYNTSSVYIRDVWYFTRGVSLTAGVPYRIRVSLNTNSNYGGERLIIKYGNDALISAMTNTLYNMDLGISKPSSILVDFIPTVTDVYYFGFNAASDNWVWQSSLYLDDIIVEQLPACVSPVNTKINTLLPNKATISWLVPILPPNNGYEWELRTTGAANSGTTGLIATGVDSVGALAATINGLTPSTAYKFYIRSRCSSGFGVWDSLLFTTLCAPANLPYTMNFEGSGYNVSNLPCTSIETIGEANTFSLVNWNGSGFSSMILIYTHSNYSGANSWFYTRGLNLTGGVTYRLSFKGRRGTVSVNYGLTPNSGSMNNLIDNITAPNSGSAPVYTRDFTPTTSGTYFIGFDCGNYIMNIDDITVQVAACTPPGSIALGPVTAGSATVSWAISASNPSSGYQWEIRTSGTAGSGATGLTASGTTSALSAIASGLVSGTPYRVYVRSNCGSGLSPWDSLIMPMPVELISFNGEVNDNDAVLNWTTASEINNKGFAVERSADGNSFDEIDFVKGAGNSHSVVSYTKTDEQVFAKMNSKIVYYRLRQQDFDGKEAYSSIIQLEYGKSSLLSKLEAHPNPFDNEVDIIVESTKQGGYTIVVSDIQGRLISTTAVDIQKGLNTITLKDLAHLNAGMYIVKLIGEEQHTIKLVKSN